MWKKKNPNCFCHLGIKVLFGFHCMSLLHQDVCDARVCCLCVDEQMHTHHTMEDGVQRHDKRAAFHQRDESVTGAAAPLVPKDDGLGWWTHSSNLELLSLRSPADFLCYCSFTVWTVEERNDAFVYLKHVTINSITTWKGWDRRSEGSSLRLLQATTAVLPKSRKRTCRTTTYTLLCSLCNINYCYYILLLKNT